MNNVIFTRISIFRNLKDYKFVPKLDSEKAQEIEEKVKNALGAEFYNVNSKNADESIVKYLTENALISKNSKNVFANKNKLISVSLFEEEHVKILSSHCGFNVKSVIDILNFANALSSKLNMAYSDEFGFLMSNLTYIGAGLNLECDLDLNAIVAIGKIEQVKQNVKKLRYNLKEKEPNIFTLSIGCVLGLTEKEIVEDFEKMVVKLQDLEIESAKLLQASKHDEVMDKVLRSEAILSSCYLMSSEELKKHLSILRTGMNLNISKLNIEKLNKIQQLITNKNSEIVSQSELITLAEKVKTILKGEKDV